jgi:hypothetical protein
MTRFALIAAAASFPVVVGCSSSASPQGAGTSGAPASASGGGGGGASSSGSLLGTSTTPACAPGGAPVFANAVCVCKDYAMAGSLLTVAPGGGAASVGVDGHSNAAAGTQIGGSFVAYGGLNIAGPVHVDDDLLSTADINGAGTLDVGGDLGVGGHLGFAGLLTVKGKLRAPNATLFAGSTVGGTGAYAAPAVPCGCADAQIIDVPAAVAAAKVKNDNAKNGFASNGLDLVGPSAITLSAGDYYIQEITRVGVSKLTIDGAVRLFIGGSLDQGGVDGIFLKPGATLDLYVEGSVATAGAVTYGDAAQPDAFRLYVGGAGSTVLTAGAQIYYGLVYAPRSHLRFAGVTEVHGALFAEDLDWSGVMKVVYSGGGGAAQGQCSPPGPTVSPR